MLKSDEEIGDAAYKKEDFGEAIKRYKNMLEFAPSKFRAAELAHKIALSYRAMRNYDQYLYYEEVAADFYPSATADQAADFLKEAGDVLSIVGEYESSKRAYEKASIYFSRASANEDDEGSVLSMRAWSTACKAKSLEKDFVDVWSEAAKMFFDAAEQSEDLLFRWRSSKGYQCLALSRIASEPAVERLREAHEEFKKAAEFEMSDERLDINILAMQCLLTLTDIKENVQRYSDKKGNMIQQLFEMSNRIRSIGPHSKKLASTLESLANGIKDDDLATVEQLNTIWNAILQIVYIFSL